MQRVDSSFLPYLDHSYSVDDITKSDHNHHISSSSSSHSQLPTQHSNNSRGISPSFGKLSHMAL